MFFVNPSRPQNQHAAHAAALNPACIDALQYRLPPQVTAANTHPSLVPILAQNCQLAAQYSAAAGGTALIVVHNGQVIYEEYPHGASLELPVQLKGATQCLLGPLVLYAIAQGKIRALDEPACLTITEWAHDAYKSKITLRMLLHGTSGLDAGDTTRPPAPYGNAIFAPPVNPMEPPGSVFRWGPTSFQIIGEILKRRVGNVREFIDALYRDKVGVQITSWTTGEDGNPLLATGACMTPREFGRVGEWLRRSCDGLIPVEGLQALYGGSPANVSYGLGWWLSYICDNHGQPAQFDLSLAHGRPSTRLYVSHALQLTVVRMVVEPEDVAPQLAHMNYAPGQAPQAFQNPDGSYTRVVGLVGGGVPWSDTEFLNRLLFGYYRRL
jgi:CubicO group peptidase (beta-lactamase class C family)